MIPLGNQKRLTDSKNDAQILWLRVSCMLSITIIAVYTAARIFFVVRERNSTPVMITWLFLEITYQGEASKPVYTSLLSDIDSSLASVAAVESFWDDQGEKD